MRRPGRRVTRHELVGQTVRLRTDNRTKPMIGLVICAVRNRGPGQQLVMVAWGDQRMLTPHDRRPVVEHVENLEVITETWVSDQTGRRVL